MRPRVLILIAALLSVVVVGAAVVVGYAGPTAPVGEVRALPPRVGQEDRQPATGRGDRPTPEPVAPQPDLSATVSVEIDGFLTWAVRDRVTGEVAAAGDQLNTTESMIKVWVVADHLRRLATAGQDPTDRVLDDAARAIRDSDNASTQRLYAAGGGDAVVARMIRLCGLRDTEIYPGWWSRTRISAVDAVRLGECVANGTAAGPDWTGWVREQMRQVRGTTAEKDQRAEDGFEGGRWGIIDGVPPAARAKVSMKNGWTRIGATSSWHVNCLAVTDGWVLAVLMRYPVGYSLDYGAERCADVARQLFHRSRKDGG